MNMQIFLDESKYVDYSAENIQIKAKELFNDNMSDVDKARAAFLFVRDEIPHSYDKFSKLKAEGKAAESEATAKLLTAKASDVLLYKTGICHAKANLLAALLRTQGIPTGFCFQHLTLADDESMGYCIHGFNAAYAGGRWIYLDARGNKEGIDAEFSADTPKLAFKCRDCYDEYFIDGIFAYPHLPTMELLERAANLDEVWDAIPVMVTNAPDVMARIVE